MTLKDFKPGLILSKTNPNTKGTGLILTQTPHVKNVRLLSLFDKNAEVPVPEFLDAKSQLLSTSDQGNSNHCVGYAIAGLVQFWNWKYLGKKKRVNPKAIYDQAKTLDGMKEEGTTLEAGLQAAQDLGLMPKPFMAGLHEIQNAYELRRALHLYEVAVTAFEITEQWMETGADGWVQDGGKPIGGHAVLSCGFSTLAPKPYFEWQGSWSDQQGWYGFSKMSPAAFEKQFQFALVCKWPDGEKAP